MTLEVGKVTIGYRDGRTIEALLYSRKHDLMRVAASGADDVLVFRSVNGKWISEDLEPVEIEFEWRRHFPNAPISEADCICSEELAARLIHLLVNGGEENQ
jgi:hypothetical protein